MSKITENAEYNFKVWLKKPTDKNNYPRTILEVAFCADDKILSVFNSPVTCKDNPTIPELLEAFKSIVPLIANYNGAHVLSMKWTGVINKEHKRKKQDPDYEKVWENNENKDPEMIRKKYKTEWVLRWLIGWAVLVDGLIGVLTIGYILPNYSLVSAKALSRHRRDKLIKAMDKVEKL